MAVTTPVAGKKFRLSTSTTLGGTYVLVKHMTAVDMNDTSQTESTPTFDSDVAFTDEGTSEITYTVNGLFVPDDPGQIAVRSARSTRTAVYFKFLPLGGDADATENVRGFTHLLGVSAKRYGAQAGPGAQTWGVDLVSKADPAITSGGYIP